MSLISAPVLLRVPKSWARIWQNVFESLVSPIHLVRDIRENVRPDEAGLPWLSEEQLQAYRVQALSVDRKVLDTLAELDGVVLKTWRAGREIREHARIVLFVLRGLEVLERVPRPDHREHLMADIRNSVIERSLKFSEIPLLEELRKAMTEENGKASAVAGTPIKPRRKRPRKIERKPVSLTPGQIEAMQLVGEHRGNVTQAAAAAGKTRQAMDKLYKKALKKLGKSAIPKPKTKALPKDRRGQANVADPKALDLNRDPNAGS